MDPAIFIGKVDIHRGIKINSCDNVCHDLADFEKKLESSLGQWKNDKLRGIWFNVALPQIEWIPILVKRGFTIHHAREEEISMCLWLAENEPNKLPHYAHYMIGAGAVVINDKKQILVVRERYREIRYWKLPGGTSDLDGETRMCYKVKWGRYNDIYNF